MSRYIDADKLNGYELGLISPKAQKIFHEIINNAPTEDVKPIDRGEWMAFPYHPIQCSNCDYVLWGSEIITHKIWNYCPNCGADMRKESEEEE